MGKVRTEQVKRLAHELLNKYPDKITSDFENNKQVVMTYTNISSTKLRNRVAGYAARLSSVMYGPDAVESEEE